MNPSKGGHTPAFPRLVCGVCSFKSTAKKNMKRCSLTKTNRISFPETRDSNCSALSRPQWVRVADPSNPHTCLAKNSRECLEWLRACFQYVARRHLEPVLWSDSPRTLKNGSPWRDLRNPISGCLSGFNSNAQSLGIQIVPDTRQILD